MQKEMVFSRDFKLVAMGQIISVFGNQILRYALPLYLLNQTGSSVLFGTILAVSFIPMLVLFPIGGIIADRVNKRNIMVILDFATAVVISGFCLLIGKTDIVLLMAMVMIILSGIQGSYQPAVNASIPVLVDPPHIMKGNSIINMINSVASMGGPVVGGVLFSIFGLTPILYVSIGCFLVSALMELFIRMPFEKRQAAGSVFATGRDDMKESFRFMFKERPVLWKISLVFVSTGLFLTALVIIAVSVIITQHLGLAPDMANRLYGYTQGVMGGGAIVGGMLAGMLSKRLTWKASPLLLTGCALSVCMGGVAVQLPGNAIATCILLAAGSGLYVMFSTLFQIRIMTFIQIITPKELIGKVIACFMCICMCSIPLGQFIYGFVFEKTGSYVYLPFYVAALTVMVIGFFTRTLFNETDQ